MLYVIVCFCCFMLLLLLLLLLYYVVVCCRVCCWCCFVSNFAYISIACFINVVVCCWYVIADKYYSMLLMLLLIKIVVCCCCVVVVSCYFRVCYCMLSYMLLVKLELSAVSLISFASLVLIVAWDFNTLSGEERGVGIFAA